MSAGLVAGLIRFVRERGVDEVDLCRRASIDPRGLENPDHRLPFAAYVALMRAAQAATEDPALALHYGEAVGMREISIVGLLMEASATIGDAYVQMRRYGRLASEVDAVSEGPRFEVVDRGRKLFLVDRQGRAAEFPELTEGAFTWLVCGPRRYMSRSPVLGVQVTWPAPPYWREYDRIFRCPVTFEAEWNALEMHPESWTWPVRQNPAYVFGMLTERADALLAELEAKRSTAGRLEALLAAELHRGESSADAMAAKMGFSRQTLFRRLKAEGTHYSAVLDDLRHRLAVGYMKGGKTSVNEVAYLVGFSDASAFSRAFKKWTGRTPGSFRRELSGGSRPADDDGEPSGPEGRT